MFKKLKEHFEYDFIKEIELNNAKVYLVGGIVRDCILNKESKDIDYLFSNITIENIIIILEKYGVINSVGKSFGVLKFVPHNLELSEPIDIVIPRQDIKMSEKDKDEFELINGYRPKGYQAFKIVSNHLLNIEDDLKRRDLTLNALALDNELNLIDPFNGLLDINKKRIKMVSINSFSEDPLRMLRAIQFASRFNFTIEKRTLVEIKNNSNRIQEISPERILIEFEKIVNKGNKFLATKLLVKTNLYQCIFNINFQGDIQLIKKSKTLSEFIFSLFYKCSDIYKIFSYNLKGTTKDINEVKCLELAFLNKNTSIYNARYIVYQMNRIEENSLNLSIYSKVITNAIKDLKSYYPLNIKEINVSSETIMSYGIKGPDIKNMQLKILKNIYCDKLKNIEKDIVEFIKYNL